MPFFSIIIPVYNAALYLNRCMTSIISQEFTNYEVLLIDDGSTDGSLELCRKWESIDCRIRVFHQVNKGAGAARNVGIRNSRGTYIQFVDSDDELTETCLETIFNLVKKYEEPDLIEFRLNYFGPSGVRNTQGTILPEGVYYRKYIEESFLPAIMQVIKNEELYYDLFNALRIVKKSLLTEHKIFFNERIRRWEDWLFAIQVFYYSECMAVTSNALYNYYGHEGGGLGGRYNPDTYKYVIETYQTLDNLMEGKYDMFSEYLIICKMEQIERCIREVFKNEHGSRRKSLLKEILQNEYYIKLAVAAKSKRCSFLIRPFLMFNNVGLSLLILYLYMYHSDYITFLKQRIRRCYYKLLRR